MKLIAAIPLLGVWLFSPGTARADHCLLSQTSPATNASSTQYNLPAVGSSFVGDTWGNTSIRRTKAGLRNQPFDHSLRRVEIRAIDSAVAFYAHTGNEFDGKVHVTYCPKGRTCSVAWSGQVGLDSFICQREFADKANQNAVAVLNNPSLPLDSAVSTFGDGFSDQVEPSVQSYVDLDTAIRWRSGVTTRNVLGGAVSWRDRYRDDLVFYKKFIMQPAWLGSYLVDVSIFIRPMLSNDRFVFDWRGHKVTIPSGFLSDIVASNIHAQIDGQSLENQLNDGIRIESGKQFCNTLPWACDANPDDDEYYYHGDRNITNDKTRMQLSFVAQFLAATGRQYFGWANTNTTAPTIVLNRDR